MKVMLLGMMFCMAAGAETLVLIPDGPITVQQQFIFGLICGSIGTFIGCAMWEIPSQTAGRPINPLMSLARQAVANLGLAALLGPTVAAVFSKTSGIPITVTVLAPISGLLGICGSAWFSKILPWLIEVSAKKAKSKIRQAFGDVPNGADDTDA